jgi:hypothetical protein
MLWVARVSKDVRARFLFPLAGKCGVQERAGPDQDSLPFTAFPDMLVQRPKWAHRRGRLWRPQPPLSTQAARRLQLFKYTAVGPGNPHVRVVDHSGWRPVFAQ